MVKTRVICQGFLQDWHGHEWKSLAKMLKIPPFFVTIVVCTGSVDCGIMTTHIYKLWHHFDHCPQNFSRKNVACIFPLSSIWLSHINNQIITRLSCRKVLEKQHIVHIYETLVHVHNRDSIWSHMKKCVLQNAFYNKFTKIRHSTVHHRAHFTHDFGSQFKFHGNYAVL